MSLTTKYVRRFDEICISEKEICISEKSFQKLIFPWNYNFTKFFDINFQFLPGYVTISVFVTSNKKSLSSFQIHFSFSENPKKVNFTKNSQTSKFFQILTLTGSQFLKRQKSKQKHWKIVLSKHTPAWHQLSIQTELFEGALSTGHRRAFIGSGVSTDRKPRRAAK